MRPVAHDLSTAPAADVDAIATYMAWVAGTANGHRRIETTRAPREATSDAGLRRGRELYVAACASCHDAGRGLGSAQAMHLSQSTSLALASPVNLLHVVQDGVQPRDGEPGRWMPAFRGAFTETQLEELARYLRAAFGRGSAWSAHGEDDRAAATKKRPG
jgi:nicotinate dehydrogenase subunit B